MKKDDEVDIFFDLPKELVDKARAAGIDIEAFCKEALQDEIYRCILKEAEENRKRR
ncbi:MAG: type II toxin-antitoxin system CcdA family antitoxin [Methanomicrobiales archaeon]|nr:type II toxin-antitoxin system CcdA family antitoxin [Methanomicrobiales archaeon]